MKRVRYARPRPNFTRTFRVKDLDQLGIPHFDEPISFHSGNRFEVVMSNRMSESFVAKLPNEFILFDVDGDDEAPEVLNQMTSITPSASSNLQELPFDSLGDPDDDDESSTGDDDPDE